MTKKDYEKFAALLGDIRTKWTLSKEEQAIFDKVMIGITNIFKEDSPKFDDDKFWEAVYSPRKYNIGDQPVKKVEI